MQYPFENIRASTSQVEFFKTKLPHVSSAMPEFFRAMAIAYKSIEQKNLYGMPQGIRQDLGIETSLKLLLIACFNDRVIAASEDAKSVIEKLRILTLNWFAKGDSLNSCLFFSYYFFTMNANALYVVKDLVKQVDFLIDNVANSPQTGTTGVLTVGYSKSWYRSASGFGDKLNNIYIQDGDFTKTDLPRPGYQIHFKKTSQYDLRAPVFVDLSCVESPIAQQGKVIMSCPSCGQKCRGQAFAHIEVNCPRCKQVWLQRT
jgi:hypothetical protein